MINRRGLITGLISFVAAPAIVKATSIMPISSYKEMIFDIETFPPGEYDVYTMQVVMKDGILITDFKLAEETRKYIRSLMRVT